MLDLDVCVAAKSVSIRERLGLFETDASCALARSSPAVLSRLLASAHLSYPLQTAVHSLPLRQ